MRISSIICVKAYCCTVVQYALYFLHICFKITPTYYPYTPSLYSNSKETIQVEVTKYVIQAYN